MTAPNRAQYYLDRYAHTEDNSQPEPHRPQALRVPARHGGDESADAVSDAGWDGFEDESEDGEESSPRHRETHRTFHAMENGHHHAARPSDDDLLGDLDVDGDEEQERPLADRLRELKRDIETSDSLSTDPEARERLLHKVNHLIVLARNPRKAAEVEEKLENLRDELHAAEGTAEEDEENRATPARGLVESLRERGLTDITQSRIQRALSAAGLTENSLRDLPLPPDQETSRNLIEFFKAVDPAFAADLESNPANPYRDSVRARIKQLLQAAVPGSSSLINDSHVVAILDKAVEVTWDGEAMLGAISGTWATDRATVLMNKINSAMGSNSNSAWQEVRDLINARMPLVGWGAHILNDPCRRVTSAIYYAAGQSPYLFRRLMNMLPENVRRDMIATLREDRGELHETQGGDAWDSEETAAIIEWTLNHENTAPPQALGGSTSSTSSGTTGSGSSAGGSSAHSDSH